MNVNDALRHIEKLKLYMQRVNAGKIGLPADNSFFKENLLDDKAIDFINQCNIKIANEDGVFLVVGDSMNPRFLEGDRIIAKRIQSRADIKLGKFYIINSPNYGYILKQVEIKNYNINYISLNPKSSLFTEELPQGHLLLIWEVIGIVI